MNSTPAWKWRPFFSPFFLFFFCSSADEQHPFSHPLALQVRIFICLSVPPVEKSFPGRIHEITYDVQGPGPCKFYGFRCFSCHLSFILKHSNAKHATRTHTKYFLVNCAPPGSATGTVFFTVFFNRGAKARERSDRARGGGCGRGIPLPPTVGIFF